MKEESREDRDYLSFKVKCLKILKTFKSFVVQMRSVKKNENHRVSNVCLPVLFENLFGISRTNLRSSNLLKSCQNQLQENSFWV